VEAPTQLVVHAASCHGLQAVQGGLEQLGSCEGLATCLAASCSLRTNHTTTSGAAATAAASGPTHSFDPLQHVNQWLNRKCRGVGKFATVCGMNWSACWSAGCAGWPWAAWELTAPCHPPYCWLLPANSQDNQPSSSSNSSSRTPMFESSSSQRQVDL
jgi:hypothetical protein